MEKGESREPHRWTQEELDSMVTLPDGTVVRFGDMTIDQHRAVAEQAVAEMAQLMSEKAANEEAAKEYPTNP